MAGPLNGVSVVELAGVGPAPFCGMVLADLGASVVRVDRVGSGSGLTGTPTHDLQNRGKESIAVDLKREEGTEIVLALVEGANVLIEGFRPGVVERLGLGPDTCLQRNPGLVYGRMTGWGQTGPLASTAGHDIDYIALSGVLHAVGKAGEPVPPLNLVGDFGGGGMLLTVGVLAALAHSWRTGEGQIVDAAMTDGSALLMTSHHGYVADGWWDAGRRESNLLDGGAPFYSVYETSDGRHVAVGALEPQFFSLLLEGLGIDPTSLSAQNDRDGWAEMRRIFASVFSTRTRDEWADHFAGTDACVAPVLTLEEASAHPHNAERGTFVEVDGVIQPGPAPRFSSTVTAIADRPAAPGEHTDAVLGRLGFTPVEIVKLKGSGVVA